MQGLTLWGEKTEQAFSTGIFTDPHTLADMESWLPGLPVYCPFCRSAHACALARNVRE